MILINSTPLVSETMEYQGVWDASSGVYPTSPDTGTMYYVSVPGVTEGVTFSAGDLIIYNGLTWDRVIGASGPGVVVSHNDTLNIDGGTVGEYYHLTQTEYSLSGTTGTGSFIRQVVPTLINPELVAPQLGAASASFITTSGFRLVPGASEGYVLTSNDEGTATWQETVTGIVIHSGLTGLTTGDDHSQYLYLSGRGGQTVSDTITLSGLKLPSGAQEGYVLVSDADGDASWGISIATPGPATFSNRVITTSGNILSSDAYVMMDCSGGTITATLPSAVANNGKLFVLKKIDGTANAAVIAASEHIDGDDSISLTISGESISVIALSGVTSTYYIV